MAIIQEFCQWLNDLPPSQALSESIWMFPIIESIHVLSIALVAGTVALVDLRVLGLALNGLPLTRVAQKLLPITWGGFAVMVLTGSSLFASEAAKLYDNPFFQLKLSLLLLAGLNALAFDVLVHRRIEEWATSSALRLRARISASLSLVNWAAIIVVGRLIAYFH